MGTLSALAGSLAVHASFLVVWIAASAVAPELHPEQADRASAGLLQVTLSVAARPIGDQDPFDAPVRAPADAPPERLPEPAVNTDVRTERRRLPVPIEASRKLAGERSFARPTASAATEAGLAPKPLHAPSTERTLAPAPAMAPGTQSEVAPLEHTAPTSVPAEVHDPLPDPRNRPPPYPAAARRRGWEGVVLLHVLVDVDGVALSVEIKESSGHGILDHAALRAVQDWTFQPALRDGLAQAGETDVSIRFRLDD